MGLSMFFELYKLSQISQYALNNWDYKKVFPDFCEVDFVHRYWGLH